MIKVRTKILITILLTAVALLGVAVLCLDNRATDDGQNATEMQSDVQVVNTATPTTELEPIFMAGLVSSTNEAVEFLLDENNSITYHGTNSYNWYKFFVKWNEPHADVDVNYVLTFLDNEGNDVGYKITYAGGTSVGEKTTEEGMPPCNVGTYTVKVEVDSDTYFVEESKSTKQFKITPFGITIRKTSADNKQYDGTSYEITVQADQTVFFGESVIYNKVYKMWKDGGWVTMAEDDMPINVGRYMVELVFDNPNYTYNTDSYSGEFTISKAPLEVDYVLQNELVYDGNDRKPLPQVTSGWKYNTANSATDSGNVTLVVTKAGQVVTDMTTVGEYLLSATCDNGNYYVANTKMVNIVKKRVDVNWTVDNQVVYDGNAHGAEAVMTGVVSGDDVSVTVKYNGKTDLPLNAGNYLLTCVFEGADVGNYDFVVDRSKAYIVIDKAVYAIDDFDVRLYDKKIIVIETDFGDIQVAFSIDGETWQQSNELEGRPMQDYEVRVKLAESANYKEKILTKTVRTGFDAEVFDQMMKDVDLEGFSFKDVVKYRELERCLTYLAEGDIEENIDVQYLNQVREAFVEYKDLAQEVTEQALSLSGAIIVKYAVGAIGALGLLGLTIVRRKKNEI
ncbi:MAG: MBG domain-containing protein [Clostridia bacterium]|nr:MBG domain-containing protein [Clostridia bacterium]MDY4083247.1 MBG domain-containing protein [Eubacteriales bacterium]